MCINNLKFNLLCNYAQYLNRHLYSNIKVHGFYFKLKIG